MMFENENTPLDMLVDTYIEQQEIKLVINELIERSNGLERMNRALNKQVIALNKLLCNQTKLLTRLQMNLATQHSGN